MLEIMVFRTIFKKPKKKTKQKQNKKKMERVLALMDLITGRSVCLDGRKGTGKTLVLDAYLEWLDIQMSLGIVCDGVHAPPLISIKTPNTYSLVIEPYSPWTVQKKMHFYCFNNFIGSQKEADAIYQVLMDIVRKHCESVLGIANF